MQSRRGQITRIVFPLLMLLLWPVRTTHAFGQTFWQNASLGDWFIENNWLAVLPDLQTDAIIANGGTALIGAPGAQAQNIFLGVATTSGATGTLTLSKPGAAAGSVTVANAMFIGRSSSTQVATGTLNLSGGASVTTQGPNGIQVGAFTNGPFGNVTLTGLGSYISTARLTLGNDTGHATLSVQSGAQMLCNDASIAGTPFIAGGSSTTGSATVTGASSLWSIDTATAFNIGYLGTGSLTISNGGTVIATRSTIATMPGSNGTATITGNGSLLSQIGGDIYVGGSGDSSASGGTAALHVLSGGLVKAAFLEVFDTATVEINNGSTTVPGLVISGVAPAHVAGSSLGDLSVGSTGAGRMEVNNRGSVANGRGYIGFSSGSNGSVLVAGTGKSISTWSCTGSIWVGNGGDGTLEIRNGGSVGSSNNCYIAFGNNSTGYAVVSGPSLLSLAGNLYVGGNAAAPGGSGDLQIEDDAQVYAAAVTVYNTGALVLGNNATLGTTSGQITFLGGSAQLINVTTFSSPFSLGTGGVRVLTNFFDGTFSGVISGTGGLDKAGGFTVGPGTLTLTNANTYTGGTTISAGRLLANNSSGSGTGSGAVTVSNGAILGGTGTISGPVTVSSTNSAVLGGGGGLASGALKIGNNLTLNTGVKIQLVLGAAGAHSTLTRTAGTWTFASAQAFTFINAGAQVGLYDNIITGLTAAPPGVGSWTITNAGFVGTFSYDGAGNIDLNLTAVPTPPPTADCAWSSATAYPVNTYGNGAASAGNFLYGFGGASGNMALASAYKFDGAGWTAIAPLPVTLYAPAVVSDGTYVYIIGGFNPAVGTQNTTYRYNPASNTYATMAPSAVATYASSAVFVNGKIYKIAGIHNYLGETSPPLKTVEIYNIAANSWSTAADYPLAAAFISAAGLGGFVYSAGGLDGSFVPLAKTYRYDPGTNTWADGAIADLPAPRYGAASARYNSSFLLAGGSVDGTNPITNLSVSAISWDSATNSWSTLPNMLQPRGQNAAAVLGGRLFVVGGQVPTPTYYTGSSDNQMLICPPPTFTVTTVDDHNDGVCSAVDCTLREAITAANARTSDDLVLINFVPGVTGSIQLTSALPSLSTNITVQGPGANLLTVRRNTGGNYRIFNITAGAVVSLNDLTMANGNVPAQSGGGINNAGTLTVVRSAVSGNTANTGGNGGGIFNTGILTISSSAISGNSVSSVTGAGSGGGIFNAGGTLTISNSTISGNSAVGPGGNSDSGGGIITNVGIVTLTNTTITGNTADFGGGVWNLNSGTVHSGNTIIALNTAPTGPNLDGVFVSDGHNLIGTASGGSGFTNGVNGDQVGVASPNLGSLGDNGGPTSTVPLLAGSPAINAGDDTRAPSFDQRGYLRAGLSDIGAFEFGGTAPPAFALVNVASRKTHGAAGSFDVILPAVESRTGGGGGNHTLVFTFSNNVLGGSANVTSGTGSISGSPAFSGNTMTVNLAGVANAQTLAVTVRNVVDSFSQTLPDTAVSASFLLGDTNGNGSVSSSDISQTKAQTGQTTNASNFRIDVNVSGSITSSDISLVKANSGTSLP